MIKLSKKDLVNLASELCASKLTNNVYDYENLIYSICATNFDKETVAYKTLKKFIDKDSMNYLEKIFKYKIRDIKYRCYANKLAYSCGIYGNTAQLHEINIYYGDSKIERIFVYY